MILLHPYSFLLVIAMYCTSESYVFAEGRRADVARHVNVQRGDLNEARFRASSFEGKRSDAVISRVVNAQCTHFLLTYFLSILHTTIIRV
jgi:hypothetical protein